MAATRPRHVYDQIVPLMKAEHPRLTVGYGPDDLVKHQDAPRFIWTKADGEILDTDRAGGNPRPIARRRVNVQAHLWGKDDDEAEALLEAVIRAVDSVSGALYSPVSELWPQHKDPEKTRLSQGTAKGVHVIVTFQVVLYVDSKPKQTAKATAVAITPTVLPAVDDGT